MQKLVLQLLRPLRARVEVFGNGRDVLARIEENAKRFDVFLLDLMMPHEGGLTVMRTLRENHPHLLRRVILMTASGAGITDKWAPEIFAVVHKPFDGSALVTAVRACVAQTDLDLATPRAIMP